MHHIKDAYIEGSHLTSTIILPKCHTLHVTNNIPKDQVHFSLAVPTVEVLNISVSKSSGMQVVSFVNELVNVKEIKLMFRSISIDVSEERLKLVELSLDENEKKKFPRCTLGKERKLVVRWETDGASNQTLDLIREFVEFFFSDVFVVPNLSLICAG